MVGQPEFAEGTLRELLLAIRGGFVLYRPVLVELTNLPRVSNSTLDHTITLVQSIEWSTPRALEYERHRAVILGPNTALASADVPITVGRSRRCDVRVGNESVSKVHCAFYANRDGSVDLVDSGARNGTFVDGLPIEPGQRRALWPGVHIALGDAVFVFLDPATLRQLARLTS